MRHRGRDHDGSTERDSTYRDIPNRETDGFIYRVLLILPWGLGLSRPAHIYRISLPEPFEASLSSARAQARPGDRMASIVPTRKWSHLVTSLARDEIP